MTVETRQAEAASEQARRPWVKRVVAGGVALILAVAGYLAWPTTVVHQPMHSSYGFDVTNLRILSGQADNIVIAKVLGVSDVDEAAGATFFSIEVTDAIKGDLTG